jgi:glycosyltransferase involved in cell wall biosynthesis
MKILHLTKKYPGIIGGDAVVVYNLKRQQELSGNEVLVVTSNCEEIIDKEVFRFGLKEYSFNLDRIAPRRILSLIILPFWGLKNLRKIKPDIIHSHSADLGFFISIATRIYAIPLINTCHGISFYDEQYSIIKRFAEKIFLKYSGFKKIITVDAIGLEALKYAKIKNCVYIPNGIDIQKFQKKTKRENNKTRFLFVGRLEKQKGVIYLLKAAKLLKDRKDFEITIVGDGSHFEHLHKAVIKSNMEGIVKFTGRIDDRKLKEYYLGSDVFILPSLWEGMPLTLMEAAAAELPIIASNVGGIPSLFTNEENALLIIPENVEALVNAMQRLAEDKQLREKLGSNARKLAEKFSWENTAKAMEEIYFDVSKSNIAHTS